MSFLNQKIQLAAKGTYQWWVIASYLLLGLMAGSIVMSTIFVYNYTFRTLEDAHTIVLLNTDMVVNNINMITYNKAAAALGLKSVKIVIPPQLRNIFSYVEVAASSSVSAPYVSQ